MNALLTYENEEWEAGRITEHHRPISPHILGNTFQYFAHLEKAPLNSSHATHYFSGAMCQGKRFPQELHLDTNMDMNPSVV